MNSFEITVEVGICFSYRYSFAVCQFIRNNFFTFEIPLECFMERFDAIFRKYHHRLFLYTLKFIENESDALDIVQEVFTTVWEKQKYKLDEEHIKPFLFNSVKNSCLNFLKHQAVIQKHQDIQKHRLVELELNHFNSGEKSLIEKEDLKKIYSAIDSLSCIHKEVIQLSRFDGLKNNHIAKKLNIPIRTVETRLYRALSELKNKLSEKLICILMNFSVLK